MLVVIGVLIALFVTSIILGTLLVVVYRRKRKQALKDFQMELQSREDKVREASREGNNNSIFTSVFILAGICH